MIWSTIKRLIHRILGRNSTNTYLNLDLEFHSETISKGTKGRGEEFQHLERFPKNVILP